MMVRVDVHEADINKIKQDQDVTVTMDTYPGLVLEGKVTKIASVANSSDYRGSAKRRQEVHGRDHARRHSRARAEARHQRQGGDFRRATHAATC